MVGRGGYEWTPPPVVGRRRENPGCSRRFTGRKEVQHLDGVKGIRLAMIDPYFYCSGSSSSSPSSVDSDVGQGGEEKMGMGASGCGVRSEGDGSGEDAEDTLAFGWKLYFGTSPDASPESEKCPRRVSVEIARGEGHDEGGPGPRRSGGDYQSRGDDDDDHDHDREKEEERENIHAKMGADVGDEAKTLGNQVARKLRGSDLEQQQQRQQEEGKEEIDASGTKQREQTPIEPLSPPQFDVGQLTSPSHRAIAMSRKGKELWRRAQLLMSCEGLLEMEAVTLAALEIESECPIQTLPPDLRAKILTYLPITKLSLSSMCCTGKSQQDVSCSSSTQKSQHCLHGLCYFELLRRN
jgi:hypothetical protein